MSVRERIWSAAGKKYLRLMPEGIGVRPRGQSVHLQRALTDFGCEHSFGQAAARVLEHYGFEIGPSAVRDTTLTQGKETTIDAATFGEVDEVGRRWGHCARDAGWGLNSQIHALGMGPNGSVYRPGKCSERRAHSPVISFM